MTSTKPPPGWWTPRVLLGTIIVAVWTISYLVSTFNPKVHTAPELTSALLVVATYIFGAEAHKRKRDKE